MPYYSNVQPGDPLDFPADLRNDLVEMLQHWRGARYNLQAGRPELLTNLVRCKIKNSSGADRDRYSILGIDDALIEPSDDLAHLQNLPEPLFDGKTPLVADHLGKWALLLEPIKAGKIGRAAIGGCLLAELNVPGGSTYPHPYADISNSSTVLTSNWYGAAEILAGPWTYSGKRWAYVRIGNWQSPTYLAKSTTTVTSGSTGSAQIYYAGSAEETVTVYFSWMHAGDNLPSSNDLLIRYYRDNQKWRVEEAKCA